MTIRMYPPLVLMALATACAGSDGEPESTVSDRGDRVEQPASDAQGTAGKPLIHVWRSPT